MDFDGELRQAEIQSPLDLLGAKYSINSSNVVTILGNMRITDIFMKINKDQRYTIKKVVGDVVFDKDISDPIDLTLFNFIEVGGQFYCPSSATTLIGGPRKVGGKLYISDATLSLQGSPQQVGMDVKITNCTILNSSNNFKKIGGDLSITGCKFKNINFKNASINNSFIFKCPESRMTSLNGMPKEVKQDVILQIGSVQTMNCKYSNINGSLTASQVGLKSSKGMPTVGGSINLSYNKLKRLDDFQPHVYENI